MPEIVARDVPFMGCCYGIGVLAHALGGEVSKARYGEPVGAVTCTLTDAGRADPLLSGLSESFRAFVGHKEAVQELPPGCVHLLASAHCPFQMIRHGRNVYATQFHPEADPAVFELRIRVYRDRGYFPPEEADALVAMCRAEEVTEPQQILHAFVERYRGGSQGRAPVWGTLFAGGARAARSACAAHGASRQAASVRSFRMPSMASDISE
jgi:GMP synthase (glutamine-hydrolysing)